MLFVACTSARKNACANARSRTRVRELVEPMCGVGDSSKSRALRLKVQQNNTRKPSNCTHAIESDDARQDRCNTSAKKTRVKTNVRIRCAPSQTG
eukprot:6210972-Pleurochrysis_carterae.AAC.2